MTVADLIEQLQSMPQDAKVLVYHAAPHGDGGWWENAATVELHTDGVRIADW